jgi:hypothetical protein
MIMKHLGMCTCIEHLVHIVASGLSDFKIKFRVDEKVTGLIGNTEHWLKKQPQCGVS